MEWTAYEIFSVLSGLILLVGGATGVAGEGTDRVWCVLGGGAMVGYGLWVASQDEGVFYFPVAIFVIPVLGAGWVLWQMYESWAGSAVSPGQTPAAAPQPLAAPGSPPPPVVPPPAAPPNLGPLPNHNPVRSPESMGGLPSPLPGGDDLGIVLHRPAVGEPEADGSPTGPDGPRSSHADSPEATCIACGHLRRPDQRYCPGCGLSVSG